MGKLAIISVILIIIGGMMDQLFRAYNIFISHFPAQYQSVVSLALLAIIIIMLFHLIRKNILWLVLLIIFVPASIPILSKIGQGILDFLKFIVSKA